MCPRVGLLFIILGIITRILLAFNRYRSTWNGYWSFHFFAIPTVVLSALKGPDKISLACKKLPIYHKSKSCRTTLKNNSFPTTPLSFWLLFHSPLVRINWVSTLGCRLRKRFEMGSMAAIVWGKQLFFYSKIYLHWRLCLFSVCYKLQLATNVKNKKKCGKSKELK